MDILFAWSVIIITTLYFFHKCMVWALKKWGDHVKKTRDYYIKERAKSLAQRVIIQDKYTINLGVEGYPLCKNGVPISDVEIIDTLIGLGRACNILYEALECGCDLKDQSIGEPSFDTKQ